MIRRTLVAAAFVHFSVSLSANAADCYPSDYAVADTLATAFEGRTPVADAPEIGDPERAECVRRAFVEALQDKTDYGRRIGYKVGLTNPAVQARFGVDAPLWGELLDGMLLGPSTTLPPDFGARGIVEADLLVTVADASINDAATPEEIARHLGNVRPFIELPDLSYGQDVVFTGPLITAVNVGARSGVAGDPIPINDPAAMAAALKAMTVELRDGDGTVVGGGSGAAILDHPLNAVLWLIGELKAVGRSLEPGDIVSLGTLGPPVRPAVGQTLTLLYRGIAGRRRVRRGELRERRLSSESIRRRPSCRP